MFYVFRTATAGQKALMEALTRDTGVIWKLNEPGLFGAKTSGFSDKVLAAIKDAGIVVEKHRVWHVGLLLLIFPVAFALGFCEVINVAVAFVLCVAAPLGAGYAWHRATTAKFGDVGLFHGRASAGFNEDVHAHFDPHSIYNYGTSLGHSSEFSPGKD